MPLLIASKLLSELIYGIWLLTLVLRVFLGALQQLNPTTLEPIELFTYQASNASLDGGSCASHPAQYVFTLLFTLNTQFDILANSNTHLAAQEASYLTMF